MVKTLVKIAKESSSDPARVAAANAVLDRAYGKPALTMADEDGNTLSWFDLLAASQRRAGLIEAPALQIEARRDVN